MTRVPFSFLACLALLSSSLLLSGCGQSAVANRKYYLLDVARPGPADANQVQATLRVRRLDVDQEYASRLLVYRVDVSRYEPDYYDQFLIPPGVMIAEETRDWLADSGLFQRVVFASSPSESSYTLEGSVVALYADFTNRSSPEAVMAIRFYLLPGPDANDGVALTKMYQAKSPIQQKTAEAVVEAFSADLADILTRLEADLRKTLTKESKK